MNIAFVSKYNVNDITTWSGTEYHLFHALKNLEENDVRLHLIDKLLYKRNKIIILFGRICNRLLWHIFHKKLYYEFYKSTARFFARQINKELPSDVDVIFSISASPIAYLKTDKIKVFLTDGDAGIEFQRPSYSQFFSKRRKDIAIELWRNAIDNCDLVFLATEWAANVTTSICQNIDTNKIKIVPFGANLIECNRTKRDIVRIVENKKRNECNLLFIGVEWERKGGNIALETARYLHAKGINVHLDIVGIKNCPVELPDYVTNHGFIMKSLENERINNLYEKAHFFILPTRYDCYGVVFCEAASFGLPSLTVRTAGVPCVVLDGKNGKLFELFDNGENYANYICTMLLDYEKYKNLCFSSFEQYETRLNWQSTCEKILRHFEDVKNAKGI